MNVLYHESKISPNWYQESQSFLSLFWALTKNILSYLLPHLIFIELHWLIIHWPLWPVATTQSQKRDNYIPILHASLGSLHIDLNTYFTPQSPGFKILEERTAPTSVFILSHFSSSSFLCKWLGVGTPNWNNGENLLRSINLSCL